MADGKTQICMVDEFARAALDVICKVSNTDTTETAEKFDFSSKKISITCSPRLPAAFPTGERGRDFCTSSEVAKSRQRDSRGEFLWSLLWVVASREYKPTLNRAREPARTLLLRFSTLWPSLPSFLRIYSAGYSLCVTWPIPLPLPLPLPLTHPPTTYLRRITACYHKFKHRLLLEWK